MSEKESSRLSSYLICSSRASAKNAQRIPRPQVTTLNCRPLLSALEESIFKKAATLTRQETELFLDIESVPDQDFHYLLGLLVCQGEIVTYHPFWANKADDVESIWQAFLALVNQYPAAPIYHYGSYEPRTIANLARQHEPTARI